MEYSFCVDVSIWHPSIDPDEITDALHRRPSRSVKVGELPARKRGGKTSDGLRPARVTTWMIDLHSESRLNFPEVEPDDIVRTFLSTLDEEERSFLRRMSAEGRAAMTVCVFTDGGNAAVCLNPDVVRECSRCGFEVCCDFYCVPQRELRRRPEVD